MKYTVKANTFVKRQVKGSGKTYSKMLSFDEIADFGRENLNNGNFHKGYRDGVVLIELKGNIVNQFICPLTKIDENSNGDDDIILAIDSTGIKVANRREWMRQK